jgi:hypothetical protein
MSESILIVEPQIEAQTQGLAPDTATALRESFGPYFSRAKEWLEKGRAIQIKDATQVREMKLARECRLALREIRVECENTRKKLKEDSLRKGKAIDGFANIQKQIAQKVADLVAWVEAAAQQEGK